MVRVRALWGVPKNFDEKMTNWHWKVDPCAAFEARTRLRRTSDLIDKGFQSKNLDAMN